MEPNSRNHSLKAAVQRKALREDMSVSERVFWEAVRKDRLGYRFRRGISVGNYHLDFYCAAAQLAVEIDGEQHSASVAYDSRRDAELAKAGIEVMRIPSLDLFEARGVELGRWLAKIEARCGERVAEFERVRRLGEVGRPLSPQPPSPRWGEGGFF